VGLAWCRPTNVTGDLAYLQMAGDRRHVHPRLLDNTCNGGVYWSTAKSYKNAISNELFLELTAAIHNRVPGDSA